MERRAFLGGAAALTLAGCHDRAPTRTPAVGAPAPGGGASERYAALAGACDGVSPPPAAEFADRRASIQAALSAGQLHALVCEPGPNLAYLSGVQWRRSERPFLMVLPRVGPPRWVVPAFEVRTAREQLGPAADLVAWQEHEDPFAAVHEALGGGSGAVALDGQTRAFIEHGVARAAGAELVDGSAVLAAQRMRKSTVELACLRRANEVTKRALASAAGRAREGMRQSEFAAEVELAQRVAGLENVWALSLFGAAASFPHGTREDRRLARGDLILVDTGGSLHGYHSDITRTWGFGDVTDEVRRAWVTVAEAQEAAFDAIGPGRLAQAADAAARKVIDGAAWGSGYTAFTHRLGHGIGLEVHEPPYLVGGNPLALAPGMTMSNEPGIYVPGRFGIRIEDILAVTDAGLEVFGPRVGGFEQPFGPI